MKLVSKKLSELKEAEVNVRMHPEKQVDEMVRSVKAFGQLRPIVTDSKLNVLAGNGLLMAMRKMGKLKADVLIVSGLNKKQKNKLMIADNKIYELGMMNNETLTQVLGELEEDGDFDVPGFDEEVLRSVFGNTDKIEEEIKEYGKLTDEVVEDMQDAQDRVDDTDVNMKEEVKITNDNIVVDEKKRPFIICKNCKEKIWL